MEEGNLVSFMVPNTKPDCLPTVLRALNLIMVKLGRLFKNRAGIKTDKGVRFSYAMN